MAMRLVRRILLVLLAGVLLTWVFRGPLYRTVVTYRIGEVRAPVVELHGSAAEATDLDHAIKVSLKETASRLHFSRGRVSNDPQRLYDGGPANCIGYSALFAALLQDQLQHSGLDRRYAIEHVVGQLYIGSWSLHALFNNPFWKDHDIVRITDRTNGKQVLVDPTLYDAVGIGLVLGV